jgi:hypothetical protein
MGGATIPLLRKAFDAEETDLIIPGGFSSDPIVRKPVEWVNQHVNRYLNSQVAV